MRKLLVVAAVAAVAFLSSVSGASAAPLICPAVGNDTLGCQFLITYNLDGSVSTGPGAAIAQGPFDGAEDTLFGVINNSLNTIFSVNLTATVPPTDIFGFEGDGACAFITCTGNDPTTYGGFTSRDSTPQTSGNAATAITYSNINATFSSGRVNFGTGGIAPGGTAWFSLEEAFSLNTVPQIGAGVPEPGSLFLLGTGILVVARRLRKA